jgi:hypothetical protein
MRISRVGDGGQAAYARSGADRGGDRYVGRPNRRPPIDAQTSRPCPQTGIRRLRMTIRFEWGCRANVQTIPVRLDQHHTARTDCPRLYPRDPFLTVSLLRREAQ